MGSDSSERVSEREVMYGTRERGQRVIHVCVRFPECELILLCKGLAIDWTTEVSEFVSGLGQEFSLPHIVQTGSGVHLTSCPVGTRGKTAGA
jgi:hypothetical protein